MTKIKKDYRYEDDELEYIVCGSCASEYYDGEGYTMDDMCPQCGDELLPVTKHEEYECEICEKEIGLWGNCYVTVDKKKEGKEKCVCCECYSKLPYELEVKKYALLWINNYLMPKIVIPGEILESDLTECLKAYEVDLNRYDAEGMFLINEKIILFAQGKIRASEKKMTVTDVLTEIIECEVTEELLEKGKLQKVSFVQKILEENLN